MLQFTSWQKQGYIIPVMLILKALIGASDQVIFEHVMMQDYTNTFLVTDHVEHFCAVSKCTAYILGNRVLNAYMTVSR